MKTKRLLLWAFLLVVLVSEGCATVRGMGEDVQSLERAVKRQPPADKLTVIPFGQES